MENILIFGHKNPDTDTIASAIALEYLVQKTNHKSTAVSLGNVNEETAFALDYFNLNAPSVIEKANTDNVILVDHNEEQQSVDNIKDLNVLAVIDHHRIANFQTANPLYYRSEPVGCTCTILLKLFKEQNIEIPQNIAGMMLSAIISDTLLYKSPTCTQEDIDAAKELAKIANVDDEKYGLEMLKAGTNNDGKTEKELINLDAKSFELGNYTVRVAQINTVDENEILNRQDKLETAMNTENNENNFDIFVLLITNILTSDSTILVIGEPKEKVEQAFNITLNNNTALLKGVVSRKKQVVPPLTESFEK